MSGSGLEGIPIWQTTWQSVVAIAVAYFIGSLNPAATIARLRGVDLAGSGSGNPGATNAGRVMGSGVGVLVASLDILKGFLPTEFFLDLFGVVPGHLAGLAAVVGHITSPFLKGRGGKGVATALGAILAVQPWWVPPCLAVFVVTVLIGKRIGIASVAAFVALPLTAYFEGASVPALVFAILLSAIILYRHKRNVRDLMKGVPGLSRPERD